ncbi:MAG: GNAT family N-acetyltransferase [Spirochaetaceae bacterium]|jgi:ribosomal-protein-alanine N-acetyltransferase|nr:GNAT family N-acetyltransferase [Spirochaetaceae bacterium]
MKHIGTNEISTQRLILRRFIIDDAECMYNNWANDNDVTKYLTWPAHESIDISRQVLEDWINNYEKPDFYQWAIVLKEINEPIGSISVVKQDDKIKMAHIGYCIGKKWWNKGITSEALKCVIKYLFEEVGMNRIEARHDPNNPNSGKVMKRCGMKYEGTMRQADWNNQGVCDFSEYAILAEEYIK